MFHAQFSRSRATVSLGGLRADGFNNTAYNLTIDLGHIQAYAELAEAIVQRMDVAKFAEYTDSRDPHAPPGRPLRFGSEPGRAGAFHLTRTSRPTRTLNSSIRGTGGSRGLG